MRILLSAAFLLGLSAAPALAQDYYGTMAVARHGNGYTPATIVAGHEGAVTFGVIAIAPDGERTSAGVTATDWKATLTTGPKKQADDDDEEDERYLDKRATTPKRAAPPAGAPQPRREVIYSSLTCPALRPRIEALKPLATFEFNPPSLAGNQDGPNGGKAQGYDLWIRIGAAELDKSAATADSMMGRWYEETLKALTGCPSSPKPMP